MSLTVSVTADVNLAEIDTDTLIGELRQRDLLFVQNLEQMMKYLEHSGCPSHILTPLQEWARLPVLDKHKLTQWEMWAGTPRRVADAQ